MTDLHTNGNYEAYLSQLFNPMTAGLNPITAGSQINPAVLNAINGIGTGTGVGGFGVGTFPNVIAQLQNPWAMQNFPQLNALSQQQQGQNPAQSLPTTQLAQQIAARQAVQALQYAQALQVLLQQIAQQLAQNLATQQWAQSAMHPQAQFGQSLGGVFGAGQTGYGFPQYQGVGVQHLINQALQQQALQQLAQNIAAQQAAQFRYGLAA